MRGGKSPAGAQPDGDWKATFTQAKHTATRSRPAPGKAHLRGLQPSRRRPASRGEGGFNRRNPTCLYNNMWGT